ncbi:MAG: Bile acid:sodium symporter, partial [Glaciihabitans sp.]|nr:Bile acid:sodium symporter [Glaciihabitans sp.]
FFVVPLVVYGLSRFVAHDEALLLGVLLVLLCPCVDYVIVFAGLAGGARDRLLAAVPVLMVAQIVLLPVYLWLFAGSATLAIVELGPFAWAAFTLIVIPLAAATVVQRLARGNPALRSTGVERAGSAIESGMAALMVPLMMATLAVVVASQVAAVGSRLADLVTVIPLFVVFAAVMLFVGLLVGRLARLPRPETTAVAFSGVTRNSLVVLPLALALPSNLAIAPLVVVTQTLVELVMMVILVRVLPPIARRFAHPVAVAK